MVPSLLILLALAIGPALGTVVDPQNFSESDQWNGAAQCTKMVFASNGNVFCGQKLGRVVVYPSITSSASEALLVWDASGESYTWHDRGLLAMAVHPDYPQQPFIWVFYSVNRVEDTSNNAPVFPDSSACTSGIAYCSAAARFVRIRVDPATNVGQTDQILMSDWCAGSGSHHVGDLNWASDGGLYLSAGDGAAFSRFVDFGVPEDICYNHNDNRDQGAFRAQWDEYLHGKIFHLPADSLMQNRLLTDGDYRMVAKGLRNPFRFTVHPVNGDLYIGDVGWDLFEEINLLPNPLGTTDVVNFGWPCFEGNLVQPQFGLQDYCSTLTDHSAPFLAYARGQPMPTEEAADRCTRANVSPAGFAFREGDAWGSEWNNRLFWTDSSLRCVFYFENTGGVPDASKLHTLSYSESASGDAIYSGQFVDLRFGTGAQSRELYMLDFNPSTMHKVTFLGDIIQDPNVVNYEIKDCGIVVDDFAGGDTAKNRFPAPNSAVCNAGSSAMKVQHDGGKLVLEASSSSSYYTTDFVLGDLCFSGPEVGVNFLQFDVYGKSGSFDIILRVKNEGCNSETDLATVAPARLWGGFSESGLSTVTIPLAEFNAPDLTRLQGIKFINLEPLDEKIEIDNIRLLQSCAVSVPTFKPTLCSLTIDTFKSATNSFGGMTDAEDQITSATSDGLLTLSTQDGSAKYTSVVRAKYCSDLSFYDTLEITHSGAGFSVYLTYREGDCSSSSTDTTVRNHAAMSVPASSASTTTSLSLSKSMTHNVYSIVITQIQGDVQITNWKFSASDCSAGQKSSDSKLLVILISSIAGGLFAIGVAACFLRRRRVTRGTPRASAAKSRRKHFDHSASPGSGLRSRPMSVRNREGIDA